MLFQIMASRFIKHIQFDEAGFRFLSFWPSIIQNWNQFCQNSETCLKDGYSSFDRIQIPYKKETCCFSAVIFAKSHFWLSCVVCFVALINMQFIKNHFLIYYTCTIETEGVFTNRILQTLAIMNCYCVYFAVSAYTTKKTNVWCNGN